MLTIKWWFNLSAIWRQVLAETFFKHANEPTENELAQLFVCPVLRLAGPGAPYPNTSIQVNDLTGITLLINLEILIVAYHQLKSITPVNNLRKLKSLFVNNNAITSLQGVEELINLEQLYVQFNEIATITELKKLVNLKECYVHDNHIASLKGLTGAHSDKLESFFCKPNHQLKQRETMRVENQLYIKCRTI